MLWDNLGVPNQPKTEVVAFRYARKDELEARAKERGVLLTGLMRELCDTYLGGTGEGEEP